VSADEARGAQVIVVLGSGSVNMRAAGRQLSSVTLDAGLRVLEAARLFDLLKSSLVIASGGITEPDPAAAPESAALQRALIDLGVPADRILLESRSKNTRDEVLIVKQMLAERGLTNFVLVTSPMHMRRSVLAFEQQGMHPIPSPSQLVPDQRSRNPLLPSDLWLSIGADALYEWLARGYYWWQGWLPRSNAASVANQTKLADLHADRPQLGASRDVEGRPPRIVASKVDPHEMRRGCRAVDRDTNQGPGVAHGCS
jgi:uncharacterized SAM-binding protein YcdF (DUF218 family)